MTASARVPDGNGWYEVKANPLSCVGVFPYSGRQLGLTGADADRMFQVYRPAEELAAPECVNSFKLIPWINDHTMLGPTLQALTDTAIPAEAKGVQGVIGEDVFYKAGTLYGNIKVFSSTLAELIRSGKKELSAGYRCVYDMIAGTFEGQHYDAVQRQIRGNHLALVSEGRMGPSVAVMDHFVFTIDSKEFIMADPVKTPAGDGDNAAPKEMTVAEITAMLGQIGPQLAKLTAAMEAIKAPAELEAPAVVEDKDTPAAAVATDKDTVAAMDSQIKALSKQVTDLTTNATRTVMQDIAKRDALVSRLTPHIGAFDHAEKTLGEVAVYGCEKLAIKVAADAALPALEGYLTAAPVKLPAARVSVGLDAAPRTGSLVQAFIDKE